MLRAWQKAATLCLRVWKRGLLHLLSAVSAEASNKSSRLLPCTLLPLVSFTYSAIASCLTNTVLPHLLSALQLALLFCCEWSYIPVASCELPSTASLSVGGLFFWYGLDQDGELLGSFTGSAKHGLHDVIQVTMNQVYIGLKCLKGRVHICVNMNWMWGSKLDLHGSLCSVCPIFKKGAVLLAFYPSVFHLFGTEVHYHTKTNPGVLSMNCACTVAWTG